jgi:hypothetical protein
MIPPCAINRLVTSTWRGIPWVPGAVVRSNVQSTHDAVVAIVENDAASTLLSQLVAPREEANTLAESACRVSSSRRGSHVVLSCAPKDAQRVAEGAQLSDDANRGHFVLALLEDCSFFARLVLRHVRAGGNPSRYLLDRYSPGKKRNVVEVSQTILRSSSSMLSRPLLMEERSLQPEAHLPSLQILWVEVGCRHAQSLVSEKERHEYRKDSKPAV